jgi:YfiH family protein
MSQGGLNLIHPDWPVPDNVRAVFTTRQGGGSGGPYASLNLGLHVGDDDDAVRGNRQLLRDHAGLPAEPVWLEQTHNTRAVDAARSDRGTAADAGYACVPGVVCVVQTADCLPLLLADGDGTCVAAVHAGWRGLAAGVIEAAVNSMPIAPSRLLAWLGPAISQEHFEVGDEVRQAFVDLDGRAANAFISGRPGKWQADMYALARLRLCELGVTQQYGGSWCTYSDSTRFYSYRRDGVTGRMAALIWLA